MQKEVLKAFSVFLDGNPQASRTLNILHALLEGRKTQREIADQFGVTHQAISDLKMRYLKETPNYETRS